LIGDFNAKERREDIFLLATGNESLHEISTDNEGRVVNFLASKYLIAKLLSSHIAILINVIGHLQIGKPSIRLIIFW
jgi:hypothetical protein